MAVMDINLGKPHAGQERLSNERSRFNVVNCGRRWGKTDYTKHLLAEIIMTNIQNGTNYDCAYMSPSYKNLEPAWREFLTVFKPIITRHSSQTYTATILDRFRIEFWSLQDPENVRGRKYKRVIVDEAALINGLREVFTLIILPTLADLQGDCWFLSTPRGFNDFYHLYEMGQNPLLPQWKSWTMPTSVNPYIPKEELEAQKQIMLPSEYAQEWEAKFVAVGNSPFDVSKFKKIKTLDEFDGFKDEGKILHEMRYWDVANSKDGDFTASAKLSIATNSESLISHPFRCQGMWGANYPTIKQLILSEPNVLHVIETAGVGGIAWQVMQSDPDLVSAKMLPAGRIFTAESKSLRGQIWAVELQNGRITILEDGNTKDLIDEVASFPSGDHDDWVDSISGGFLTFIYYYGGYQKLLVSKRAVEPKQARATSPHKKYMLSKLAKG